jgi:RNA polymerase sigma factor (TIGR02999 family)
MDDCIASLLREAERGNDSAADRLFTTLYEELHRMAERQLGVNGRHLTLGATTLLHEAYLNIAGREGTSFPDRASFMAYAARAMRGLLIDYGRSRRAVKRGGEFHITALGDTEPLAFGRQSELEQLDALSEALTELTAIDPSLAELVDLHFFCGFTFVEIAAMRRVSERTVQRDWRKARLLLHRELHDELDHALGASAV